jgi:hypothetical protein
MNEVLIYGRFREESTGYGAAIIAKRIAWR